MSGFYAPDANSSFDRLNVSKAMSPIVLLFKSLVPAHTRRLKTGKVVNVRQYTDKRTKRMEDDKTLDMFADDDTITTPRQEMIDEHKRLVDVLESPSRKDDKVEAKKQKEELAGYEEKADPRAKQHADVGEALASKGWKKQGDRWKKTYQDVRALGAANVTTGEWSVRFDRSFAVIERGWDKQTVMLADNFSPEKNADRIIEKVEEQVEAERKRYGGKPAKPDDDTPQIDAMIARAKALGFDGIGIKASLELYRNGKNPGQGVTSREEGIANLERMLAAAEAKAKPTPRVTSVTQKEGDGKILGYDWEDIQRAQQGGTLSRRVDTSKPVDSDVEKFRESDEKLLAEHGEQGLRDKQFFGVLDRLERTGRLGKPEAPVLKPSEVNGAKLKELIGNGLGVHEFDVEGGGKVKAEVKVTKRNGEVKTKYLHITAIQPGGAWVYYREQANGNFKEVASGRGTPPKVVSVKASKPKADAAPVPRKISRAFSKESFAYRTKNFKVGTVGGWTLLRVPHLEGNGADWELANSYNLVAFDDEQSARQWAAKNRSNNRRYLDESGRYSDGSA